MKLRIKGNSIRLRLTKPDLERFAANGTLSETLDFGEGESGLTYTLSVATDNDDMLRADFDGGELRVTLPAVQSAEWTSTERVGLTGEAQNGITILVEKDFACLTPRHGEDESEMFSNPLASHCEAA
jgi:hypothetical protein